MLFKSIDELPVSDWLYPPLVALDLRRLLKSFI